MPIWEKTYLRESKRRKLGFREEVRFGAKIQPICSRYCKKKKGES